LINDQGQSITQPLPTNIYQNEPSAVWKAEIQIARPHWVFEAVGGFAGTEPPYIPEPASEIGKYGFTSGLLSPAIHPKKICTTSFSPERTNRFSCIFMIATK
jgi:hypothetical protein